MTTTVLIFSKDRPMQLDACLRSLRRHCLDYDELSVNVLWTASSPDTGYAYLEMAQERARLANFHPEEDFEAQTQALLHVSPFSLLVVDDTVFVRGFSNRHCEQMLTRTPDAIAYSLRLGRNLRRCYPHGGVKQKVPRFVAEWATNDGATLALDWSKGEWDWGYPMDVSSTLYRSQDLVEALAGASFENPNQLEYRLATSTSGSVSRRPLLLCPDLSLAFSVPANRVQSQFPNRFGDNAFQTRDALASRWNRNGRIRIEALDGFAPESCHQEVDFEFEERPS